MELAWRVGRSSMEAFLVVVGFLVFGELAYGPEIGGPIEIFPTLAVWVFLTILVYVVFHR